MIYKLRPPRFKTGYTPVNYFLEKQYPCFYHTIVPLYAYTAQGLSRKGRYPLLPGLTNIG